MPCLVWIHGGAWLAGSVDSLGTNKICFHQNMYLVNSIYHPQIINNIKLGIDSIGKHIKVDNVEFRVMVFPEWKKKAEQIWFNSEYDHLEWFV